MKTPHSVFHDSNGEVFCFDEHGNDIPYPSDWPKVIGHVETFCRHRGIQYNY